MKNFCVIHILLFFLIMLVYQCAKAQDYVVTTKGDTIRGDVKPLSYGPEKKVQVTTPDKGKTTYSIFQTRAFRFKEEVYQPVKSDRGYVFMKLIKPGYLSLYAFQPENQVAFDGMFLQKRDGSGMEVPNLSFKKQMTRFLGECEKVAAKIESGDLSKKSIDQIVDEYNKCIDDRTADHGNAIVQQEVRSKKISSWDVLEEKVKAKGDFEGKTDAIEMIADIKSKISRGEKVPNFLLEGLKSSLSQAELSTELEHALNDLKN
jgi:hypothetical protein